MYHIRIHADPDWQHVVLCARILMKRAFVVSGTTMQLSMWTSFLCWPPVWYLHERSSTILQQREKISPRSRQYKLWFCVVACITEGLSCVCIFSRSVCLKIPWWARGKQSKIKSPQGPPAAKFWRYKMLVSHEIHPHHMHLTRGLCFAWHLRCSLSDWVNNTQFPSTQHLFCHYMSPSPHLTPTVLSLLQGLHAGLHQPPRLACKLQQHITHMWLVW